MRISYLGLTRFFYYFCCKSVTFIINKCYLTYEKINSFYVCFLYLNTSLRNKNRLQKLHLSD